MAGVYYEYRDDQGRIHKVGKVEEVPKKYFATMTAVGEPEPSPNSDSGFAPISLGEAANPTALALVVLFAAVIKSKNFLIRCVALTTAILIGVFHGYGLFMGSEYSKTAVQNSEKKGKGAIFDQQR